VRQEDHEGERHQNNAYTVEQPMKNQESEAKSAAWKYVEKRTAPERGLRGRLFFCHEIGFLAIC
jgi:hypothetical protein